MFAHMLANYIGTDAEEIERLLGMSQNDIFADPTYVYWVRSLPQERLDRTLALARDNYATHMPEYHQHLAAQYGMPQPKMSAYTLGNWLVGYLQYPDMVVELPSIHHRLPREAVIDMLPTMLETLGEMPEGAADWQRALAVLALPLAAQPG